MVGGGWPPPNTENSSHLPQNMTATSSTRVFLVDDHPIIRDGFRNLLEHEGNFVVAGEAGSGEETLSKASETEIDLAVVDISMDDMNGIELTRRLKKNHPEMYVLIVSMHSEKRYVEEAFDAGASGYVLKDNVHKLLVEAAENVTSGQVYLCPDLEGDVNLG